MSARTRLRVGRSSAQVRFVEDDDGSIVVVYDGERSARFASLAEVLELHGLTQRDVLEENDDAPSWSAKPEACAENGDQRR